MYAVSFDLDTEALRTHYGDSFPNAYTEIRKFLFSCGFEWQQGSVYFGKPETVNAVSCMLSIQKMSKQLPWFGSCVRDIRMLRIEENNDLMPVILG